MTLTPSAHVADLLSAAERAVLAAGAHIVSLRRNSPSFVSSRKEDGSLVMRLDRECERIASSLLAEYLPIVSEEDEATHPNMRTHSMYYVLDPLDGTSACKRFFREKQGQIGFGPLVGVISNGSLCASTFYHIPNKTLYSSIVGHGTRKVMVKSADPTWIPPYFKQRRVLPPVEPPQLLSESVMLFYIGQDGEGSFVDKLKQERVCANFYRFGGFANDCVRLATGREDLLMQLSIKPWDFSACLLPAEMGFGVYLWDGSSFVDLKDWKVQMNNPLFIIAPHLKDEFAVRLETFFRRE